MLIFELLQSLCCSFVCFEAVSTLKTNLAKSELLLVGSVDDVHRPASILGYWESFLPMTYLGLP